MKRRVRNIAIVFFVMLILDEGLNFIFGKTRPIDLIGSVFDSFIFAIVFELIFDPVMKGVSSALKRKTDNSRPMDK